MNGAPFTVLVGVDSNPHSQRALNWALHEATCRNGRLRVIHAWSVAVDPAADAVPQNPAPALQRASETLCALVLSLDTSGLCVQGRLVEGWAGVVLADQARDADVLVVGRRTHSRVRGILVPSICDYLMRHAPCPLVMV